MKNTMAAVEAQRERARGGTRVSKRSCRRTLPFDTEARYHLCSNLVKMRAQRSSSPAIRLSANRYAECAVLPVRRQLPAIQRE